MKPKRLHGSRSPILCAFLCAAACVSVVPPKAAPSSKPNILFAIADDWSYGHAGAYGSRWVKTPAFDRVAQQGLLFSHTYTPNAKCAPSRASILTGRNSWQLKAACNHIPYFPPEFKTYAEALREQGCFVGTTGKGWAPGIATNLQGQARPMTGQPFNKRTAPPPAKGISNNDYAGNFADFLAAAPPDKPWCFWYGALEPHRGYEFGSGVSRGGKSLSDIDRVPGSWPDTDIVRNDLLDYAYEVEHFDRHLGRMLDQLERTGQLDNTLIVVTSDHGMPFPRAKGQAYDQSNRVPLAIMWKSGIVQPGRLINDHISLIDLAPTFITAAGLDWAATGMAPSPGRSLLDLFRSTQDGQVDPTRDHVLIGKERHDIGRPHDWGYPIRGIVRSDHLYLRNFETNRWPAGNPETGYLNCDGGPTKSLLIENRRKNPNDHSWALAFGKRPAEELYDLKADPDCLHNLAANPRAHSLKLALQQQLFSELKVQNDPRMFGRGAVFEQYPYADPARRGFYERYRKGEKISAGWVNPSDFEPAPLD